MAMFTSFTRRKPSAADQSDRGLREEVRRALPMHYEAIADALLSDGNVMAACEAVGRDVARDGADLGEALSGLRTTFDLVVGEQPSFEATTALSMAWSEAALQYLHQLSCEDPLTGLASLAHLRTRLDEMYREAELTDVPVRRTHALVIVELVFPAGPAAPEHAFTRALRLVQLTEMIRSVWSGGQTIGRLGLHRAVAVVPRNADLGMSVGLLRDLIRDLDLGEARTRLWIEGLPPTGDGATRLLDELAR